MPDQRRQPLLAGRAEHPVNVGHGDPARRKGQQLLQQRLAVAHRAGRPPGEDLQGLRLRLDPFRRHDLLAAAAWIERVRMPAKSNRWHRERIVIGIFVGSVVQKMNLTCSGGSSRVFSRALKASRVSMWTSSMM